MSRTQALEHNLTGGLFFSAAAVYINTVLMKTRPRITFRVKLKVRYVGFRDIIVGT